MEGIEALRKSVEAIAKDSSGRPKKQPKAFTIQTNASDFIGVIMSLPVNSDTWEPLQDSQTGQLYYVPGASPFGTEPIGG